jgi:hypothetical protein
MKYSLSELKEMFNEKEITREQYFKFRHEFFLNERKAQLQEPNKPVEVETCITEEIKKVSTTLCEMIEKQDTGMELSKKYYPAILTALQAIKVEAPEGRTQITEWEINAKRDDKGLIKFPITMKAVK